MRPGHHETNLKFLNQLDDYFILQQEWGGNEGGGGGRELKPQEQMRSSTYSHYLVHWK